jgi:hypothetical protein
MLDLYEDHDDRLSTVVQINCLANRAAGVLVGHAPPSRSSELLPQDLLLALGHQSNTRGWPATSNTGWPLARAWMAGFQISHLVIYGGWRITDQLAAVLSHIANSDAIRVSVVTLAAMKRHLPAALASLAPEPVEALLQAPHDQLDEPRPSTYAELPDGLPPLPPADPTCFLSECSGCLEDNSMWRRLVRAFDAMIGASLGGLRRATCVSEVLDLLENRLRCARTANDFLVETRAFQVAALHAGWHVCVPLRDVATAAAMALDTAAANHQCWPLPGDVSPENQALAALAWATGSNATALSEAVIGDLDDDCAAFAGQPIDESLRVPLRALLWLHRENKRDTDDPLFRNKSGTPRRPNGIRQRLDAIAPAAHNTAQLGPSTVHRSLTRLASVTRITPEHEIGDAELRPDRLPQLPSARYWEWTFANGADDLETQTGLPGVHSDDPLAADGHGFAQAITAATGFTAPQAWVDPDNLHGCERSDDEKAQADASRLHAVLLSTGGGADRLSLIHGFRWTADRLHAAELMLRAQLAGTAEILAATLDGRLELRLRTDGLTSAATSVVQARAHCDDGLSTAATRLVYELLAGPNLGTPVNEIQMPPEISRVALEELRQRHLVYIERQGLIVLAERIMPNLRCIRSNAVGRSNFCA